MASEYIYICNEIVGVKPSDFAKKCSYGYTALKQEGYKVEVKNRTCLAVKNDNLSKREIKLIRRYVNSLLV